DDVIVIGPSHRHGFHGASVDTLAGRMTPLGRIDYDSELAKKLIAASKEIKYEAGAHAVEHSVEIQMPFIQVAIPKFKAVEIIMGSQDYTTCQMLSQAIVKATKGRKVLVIASSDLSHYHTQKQAEVLDNLVVEAVAAFDPELLFNRLNNDSCEACGGGPMITAMLVARELGATGSTALRYATSGDITGDHSQVVGYLAAVFHDAPRTKVGVDLGFSEAEKKHLKEIAWASIESAVRGKKPSSPENITGKLKEPYGIFVTIRKHGDLRGCIGRIIGDQPLFLSCQQMAHAAALEDPRFPPVTSSELKELEIEISVLTPMQRVKSKNEIVVGRDGLYIRKGMFSGLLLPQVAVEEDWNVDEFLAHTCYKAGLPTDSLRAKDIEIYRFSAEVF
ncbi:AmmeMemoRadiSam system protein B, partial [candidate division WOR-3 bacterium]|nr:AmmeMemoRadiSam system protein B [candidate division WOR-3 bacterium]